MNEPTRARMLKNSFIYLPTMMGIGLLVFLLGFEFAPPGKFDAHDKYEIITIWMVMYVIAGVSHYLSYRMTKKRPEKYGSDSAGLGLVLTLMLSGYFMKLMLFVYIMIAVGRLYR